MCGINGFNFQDVGLIKKMNHILLHRGPDFDGFFVDDSVSIGSVRLSIMDLSSAGKMPMTNEDGTIWITYNGEIYNFKEIKTELENNGHTFSSGTDTEVIIHGYEQWGFEVVSKLNGMWAFCIYDSRSHILFFSRDRMGIKPLYYYFKDGRFLFSSELKTFTLLDDLRPKLSYEGLHEMLLFSFNPYHNTVLESVYKLPAGSNLVFNLRTLSIEISSYWVNEQVEINSNLADVKNLIENSIKRHIISDVPVGSYVSGGLDSLLVTLEYSKSYPDILHTFTVGFDSCDDERRYANFIAQEIGSKHHELIISPETMRKSFDEIIYFYDLSLTDPAFIPNYLLSKYAKRYVTVVLAGEGGDEVFGGYDYYRYLYFANRGKMLNSFPYIPNKLLNIFDFNIDFVSKGAYAFKNKQNPQLFNLSYLMLLPQNKMGKLFKKDVDRLLHKIILNSNFNMQYNDITNLMLKLDQRTLLGENYNMKADKSTSAASLEERVPLQDYHLVEYMNSVPINKKINYLQGKLYIRAIVNQSFPQLSKRKKRGYVTPLQYWLRHSLNDLVEYTIRNKNLRRIMDNHELDKMYSKFLSGTSSVNELLFIWNILFLLQGLEKYDYLH